MTTSISPTMQWHGAADNVMMQRVKQWLADGRTLAWLPIFSSDNFPDIPKGILYDAEQSPERHCWLIHRVEDFLQIPEGITGWVLPEGDINTEVVVGLWEDTLHFVKVIDRRTGEPQTLQTGRAWEIDEQEPRQTPAGQA